MIRFVVASDVGSGVASRRFVPDVSPGHRPYTRVEGQRQAPQGRQSRVCRAFKPRVTMSAPRITTARLRQLAAELFAVRLHADAVRCCSGSAAMRRTKANATHARRLTATTTRFLWNDAFSVQPVNQ